MLSKTRASLLIFAALAGFLVLSSQSEAFFQMAMMLKKKSDPCAGASIGDACAGGALYAGTFGGSRYMIVPRGCSHESGGSESTAPTTNFTPTCPNSGDDPRKYWNDGSSNWYLIPGVESINTPATRSSPLYLGDVNTPIIASVFAAGDGGLHGAARYCYYMDYGGFTDWYLPSKSELAYMYCKSRTSGNASYPEEDPDCADYGYGSGSNILSFEPGWPPMWASTQSGDQWARIQFFDTGRQNDDLANNDSKSWPFGVRCVRRY